MGMFCYQCEQTAKGSGCSAYGVCGKDPETAALQDLLIAAGRAIAACAHRLRTKDVISLAADRLVARILFTTVTNVNFDPLRLQEMLQETAAVRDQLLEQCEKANLATQLPEICSWQPSSDLDQLIRQGEQQSVEKRISELGPDLAGLQELLTYGLKGTAAYAVHAAELGSEDPQVYAFFHEALNYLNNPSPSLEALLQYCLRCGEVNLRVMELLDAAHNDTFGHPEPTAVRITPVAGKALLVSGHDLKDLEQILQQTAGTGINVYTHGEMLPAHGYPRLKAYKHLVGNYGGAWQDQQEEFDAFPGSIVMTTNCIQRPKRSYHNRIFTTGLVAWPDVTHLSGGDFGPAIEAALAASGFAEDQPERKITVGFGHHAVLGVADKIIDAVKTGAIKHFFLIGGCDGAKPGRNYYTEFARAVPSDSVILTLACGKYRFNREEFGEIGGIPRLLDLGQCNDAYSAIKIAGALADAFGCGVNDLPLSIILSWYEQKAVCILLSLLHLGIKSIRLGPTLPAFVSPATLQLLVDNYGLMPTDTVDKDLASCLQ